MIGRNQQIVDQGGPAIRAAVLEAMVSTRRVRAQLRVTVRDCFNGLTPPDAASATYAADTTLRGQAMVATRPCAPI